MTILVTRNPNLFLDLGWTPRFDEAEPVAIGVPLVEAGENPRYAVIHDFAEIAQEWVAAYCSGENPTVIIMDNMPDDWIYNNLP